MRPYLVKVAITAVPVKFPDEVVIESRFLSNGKPVDKGLLSEPQSWDEIRGWLLAKPMELNEIAAYLRAGQRAYCGVHHIRTPDDLSDSEAEQYA